MKTRTKALLLALSAVLLVVSTVFATLAFLTSQTDVVKNTFTVGNVTITLDEADVDDSTPDKDRDTANKYHLVPGRICEKDPTVHVGEKSENCFVYVKVENGILGYEADDAQVASIAKQMETLGWLPLAGEANVFYYQYVAGANQHLPVFRQFKIAGNADVEAIKDKEITIVAYAIQAEGFGSAAEAWAAAPTSWN